MDVNLVRTALPSTIAGVLKVSDVHDNPIKGNTGNGDGLGLNKVLKTDNNGVLQVNNIGGAGSSTIIKGNDGDDGAGTDRTVKTDEQGHLEVHILGTDSAGDQSEHRVKVNDNGEVFTQIRPTNFTALPTLNNAQGHGMVSDSKGRLRVKATLEGLTNITDETTFKPLKSNSDGHLEVAILGKNPADGNQQFQLRCDSNHRLENKTQGQHTTTPPTLTNNDYYNLTLSSDASLRVEDKNITTGSQKTQIYGNSNSAGSGSNNEAIVTAHGALLVIQDGGVQIDAKTDGGVGKDLRCDGNGRLYAGLNAYTDITDDTTAKRLKCTASGEIITDSTVQTDGTQKTKMMAQVTGASDVQLQSDANGVLVVQNQPTRGQLQISGAAIATWNNNAYSDTVGMGNFQVLTVHISCVSSSLNQTENFIVEGTDDAIPSGSSNYYPYKVLKPQSGATNNFYKATFLFPYQNFRIQNRTGSNQGLLNSEGSFYMLSNGSGTEDLDKDSTNKLNVVSLIPITRGEIGGMTDGAGSGFDSGSLTSAIDMGDNGTIHFHIQGSFTNSHTGLIINVSNDNTTYVKEQLFTVQQVGGTYMYKGSFTSGFRYIKFENGGGDIASTTYKQYAIYNT